MRVTGSVGEGMVAAVDRHPVDHLALETHRARHGGGMIPSNPAFSRRTLSWSVVMGPHPEQIPASESPGIQFLNGSGGIGTTPRLGAAGTSQALW
ncbi:hypothetical protein Acsp03_71770 [Actinomadura sp. NBRC 104412]|nr:hypothetical protein Acsp03_71770 [Actinomadura sp. NBRC 104412]